MSSRRCGAVPPEPHSRKSNCVIYGGSDHAGPHRNMHGVEWEGDFADERTGITEIRIDEHGDEEHESWVLIRANRVSSGPPGRFLFDSEIGHQHYIQVCISRCTRRRDLNHDFHYGNRDIIQVEMSEAQWGAFVSSFGNGSGVPATLTWLNDQGLGTPGEIYQAPHTPRLAESHREVREAGTKALAEIQEAYAELQQAFDDKAGRKVMGAALDKLKHRMGNAPGNMAFAAKSLTEHAENVVTKARADIEAMVLHAQQGADASHLLGPGPVLELEAGEEA